MRATFFFKENEWPVYVGLLLALANTAPQSPCIGPAHLTKEMMATAGGRRRSEANVQHIVDVGLRRRTGVRKAT